MISRNRTTNANDGILRIDCRQCPDEPDVGSVGCIRCICGHIDVRTPPENIILRSGSEKMVDRQTTDVISKIAKGYHSVHVGRSDRQCRGCVLSGESLESEKWYGLSSESTEILLNRLDCIYVNCQWEAECLADAKKAFAQMKDSMDSISKEAAKNAFRII